MSDIKYFQGFERYLDNLKNEEIAKNISIYGKYDIVKRYSEKAYYDGQKALLNRILEDIKNPDIDICHYFDAYKKIFSN